MYERLRTRAGRVEREPEAPQPAGGRPARRSLAVPHGKMLGQPGEQHIPALITGRTRRVFQQSQTYPGWLLVVLLEELNDQPPLRVEVRLGRDETSQISKGDPVGKSLLQSAWPGPV